MIKVELISGPPGCGKTSHMRSAAIAERGRYLFALPTIALIEEQASATRLSAPLINTLEVHGLAPNRRGSVVDRLGGLPEEIGADEHAIVYATHEALMAADLSAFGGWRLRIDEVPQAVTSGVINVSESLSYFREGYSLDPLPGSPWSEVQRNGGPANWKAVARDDLAKPIAEFSKLAARPAGLFVDARSWQEVEDRGQIGSISLWTPLGLGAFADVALAAASPMTSLCVRAWTALLSDEVQLTETQLPYARTGWPEVRVHYFAGAHEGSTSFWSTGLGADCLSRVSRHLEQVTELGYWSCNEAVALAFRGRLSGEMVAPKLAGQNRLRESRSCALVYSAKPTPGDQPLYDLLGLTADDVRRAREEEDIAQFVMRGAIRQAAYGGDYDIYLYSLAQAEALGAFLRDSGLAGEVDLVALPEAGILDIRRRGRTVSATESPLAKREKKRTQDAERQRRRRARIAEEEGRVARMVGRPTRDIEGGR